MIKKILHQISNTIFPKMCIGCMERSIPNDQGHFCVYCLSEIPFTDHFSSPNQNLMCERLYGRLPVNFAVALLYFSEGNIVQNMMHLFKYKSEIYIGQQLGDIIGSRIMEGTITSIPEIVLPVPMHAQKKLVKGFNQSAIIGQRIAEKIGASYSDDFLIKIIPTSSQTSKNKMERMDNLRNTFSITPEGIEAIKDKHILIVDDTVTTGATVEACGKLILKNGAKEISVACAALAY